MSLDLDPIGFNAMLLVSYITVLKDYLRLASHSSQFARSETCHLPYEVTQGRQILTIFYLLTELASVPIQATGHINHNKVSQLSSAGVKHHNITAEFTERRTNEQLPFRNRIHHFFLCRA